MPELIAAWGWLPIAVPLALWTAREVGRALPVRDDERGLAGGLLHTAWVIVGVRVLAQLGLLARGPVLAWLAAGALIVFVLRRRPHTVAASDRAVWPMLALCAGALSYLVLCALLLPVWQWDALGYHLPLVNFLLERGSLHDLPPDIPFLSTYPRNVEYYYAAVRALLPDDTLVDAAQLPFAPLAILAVATLAQRLGATRGWGLIAGCAFVLVPAAFLQLPTNYIDFACAAWLLVAMAFALGADARPQLWLCALALGLFLGSKSNGPIGVTLVLVVALVRGGVLARGASHRGLLLLGLAALILLLGSEMYVVNLLRHRNPLWPIDARFGPVHLAGTVTVEKLLAAGARIPRVHGVLPWRIVQSWTALTANPVFDMRYGGFGALFLCALAVAIKRVWTLRRAAWPLALFAAAALASPDPVWPRYVLAFPALVLAIAASEASTWRPARARLAHVLVWALSVINVLYAAPGLTGEGPPLSAYFSMTSAERARAVWAESPVEGWFAARDALSPGQNAAYDFSMELPYLLWDRTLDHRVFRIPDHATPELVQTLLTRENVHLLVAGDDEPAGALVRSNPAAFHLLFRCPFRACTVYRL